MIKAIQAPDLQSDDPQYALRALRPLDEFEITVEHKKPVGERKDRSRS